MDYTKIPVNTFEELVLNAGIIVDSFTPSSGEIGNILGANIIDITLILPLCSIISGGVLPVSQASFSLDMPFCLAEALIAVVPTIIRRKFSRLQGVAMLLVYGAYLAVTFIG